MDIVKIIKHLFPDARPFVDFACQDDSDGKGPYISSWNLAEPMPTLAELTAAEPAALLADNRQAKIAYIDAAFAGEENKGFVTSSGVKMDSTMADLQTLKLAYDFAVLMNETAMTIVDFDNVAHVAVPLPDVMTLIMEIGANYRDLFLRKQTLRGQAMAAQTISELDLITWS